MTYQRKLTEAYISDWNHQMRKAQRHAETQELRGQAVSAPSITLHRDYKYEQKVIQASNIDLDIFNQEIKEN